MSERRSLPSKRYPAVDQIEGEDEVGEEQRVSADSYGRRRAVLGRSIRIGVSYSGRYIYRKSSSGNPDSLSLEYFSL